MNAIIEERIFSPGVKKDSHILDDVQLQIKNQIVNEDIPMWEHSQAFVTTQNQVKVKSILDSCKTLYGILSNDLGILEKNFFT